MELHETLRGDIAAIAADEGLELLAVEVNGSGSKLILRLIVDGPEGVTLDQCAAVSRQASSLLDVEDPATHGYTLEVSSPGLDRKLYSLEDYSRFSNRQVRVRMKPSYREHRTVVGQLLGIEGERIRVVPEGQDDAIELPFDEIFEARIEVDWKSIMKEGKGRP
ncbi:MAG: ribosome maturation factor RimP [bacterium]|nr:ribosome maturation factor RimP [bacterium]